ncbi:hypothetical protein LSAT2_020421 [Lamellibrachia satsuma]|nr:hypothetical protein LSAT2_020421 [Lamellibrachia satsuma]
MPTSDVRRDVNVTMESRGNSGAMDMGRLRGREDVGWKVDRVPGWWDGLKEASRHVQLHDMSSVTTCPASRHVQRHHMSSVTTCPASRHVQRHHMSSVTTCPASPHV